MKAKSVLWMAVLLVAGCVRQGAELPDYFHDDDTGVELKHTPLEWAGGEAATLPGLYYVIDDYIVASSQERSQRYALYRVEGERVVDCGSFLYRGRGPKEMLVPQMTYDYASRKLTLVDIAASNRVHGFTVDLSEGMANLFDANSWEPLRVPEYGGALLRIQPAGAERYLALIADSTDAMYTVLDVGAGKAVHTDVLFPAELSDLERSVYKEALLGSRMAKRPSSERYVYSASESRYIFFFSLAGGCRSVDVKRIAGELPEYELTGAEPPDYPYRNTNPGQETGVKEIAVTDDYVFMPYNRVTQREYRGTNSLLSSRVNVFDWRGEFVVRLLLDKPIVYCRASSDNRYLYATTLDPQTGTPEWVRFELPELK